MGSIVYDYSNKSESLSQFFTEGLWSKQSTKALWFAALCLLVIIFILNFNKLKRIYIISLIGIIGIFFGIIIFIIRSYDYIGNYWEKIYNKYNSETWIVYFDFKKAFDLKFNFFKIFTGCFVNFGLHAVILPISSSFENDTYPKTKKVINYSMLVFIIIYLIIGTVGFFWFPINTPKSILVNDKVFESDILLEILRVIVLVIAVLRIPLYFYVFRISLNQILFGRNEISRK